MIKRTPARAAFTLIELLVVISIIAVLVGLLVVGVLPMLRRGPDIRDVNDISQIAIGIQDFKTRYKMYPPSRIKLCSRRNQYDLTLTGPAIDKESVAILNRLWNRLGSYDSTSPTDPTKTSPFMMASGGGIDWAGNGSLVSETLEGDQCLVFFLGGPQGINGFSKSPLNPCASTSEPHKSFIFNAGRLALRQGSNFPSYTDNWATSNTLGVPRYFVYFSSGSRPNGYHSGFTVTTPTGTDNVQPIYLSSGKYHNSDSFQIITAGRDGLYGGLGQWSNGSTSDSPTPVGWQDNRSNFSPNILAASSTN